MRLNLSVPDHLDQLAEDIREMELSLEVKDGERSDNCPPWMVPLRKKRSRATSFHDVKDLDERKESLISHCAQKEGIPDCPTTVSEDDRTACSTSLDEAEQPPTMDAEDSGESLYVQPSFLPGFEDDTASLTSSIRMPVVEETDDEIDASKHDNTFFLDGSPMSCEREEKKQQDRQEERRAKEAVEALAGLFFLDLEDSDLNGESNNSRMQKDGGLTSPSVTDGMLSKVGSMETKLSRKDASSTLSLPGRPQMSMRQRDVENDDDNDGFVMLKPQDRANSLPLKLNQPGTPRLKPALKSSNSIATNGSSQDESFTSLKRTVSFGKLQTREYNIALSDHPACSFGAPVGLGWEFKDKPTLAVDDYENERSPRRSMEQMVLSYNVRRYLLLKRAGYSKTELKDAVAEVERVKRERLITDLFLPTHGLDETMEEAISHIKKLFSVS